MSVPSICYLDLNNRFRGSGYKYYRMFSRIADEHVNPEFADVCFVPFDHSRAHRTAMKFDKPYILNLHDVRSLRHDGSLMPVEVEAIRHAASIICPSPYLIEWVKKYTNRHVHYAPTMPLLSDITFEPVEKRPNTLVYAGNLGSEKATYGARIRSYLTYFVSMMDEGIEVHLYGPSEFAHEYVAAGCRYHGMVPQSALYQLMSQYSAGLTGYGEDWGYLKYCQPNKTWEYLGAGIPTIGFGTVDNAAKVFVDGGWGIVKQEGESWRDVLDRAQSLDITDEMRFANTLDKYAHVFDEVLEEALS